MLGVPETGVKPTGHVKARQLSSLQHALFETIVLCAKAGSFT